jgi:hypothetical protein
MLKAGLFLPTGAGVTPEPCFVDGYEDIQAQVGGLFDVVVTSLGDGDRVAFVGHVHDEGLLLGLEMNYLATALFQREIRGGCVVLWGLNEDGVYDGDNYDIPEEMSRFLCEELVGFAADTYNQAVVLDIAMQMVVKANIATQEEVDAIKFDLYRFATLHMVEELVAKERELRSMLVQLGAHIKRTHKDENEAETIMSWLAEMCDMLGNGPLFGGEED